MVPLRTNIKLFLEFLFSFKTDGTNWKTSIYILADTFLPDRWSAINKNSFVSIHSITCIFYLNWHDIGKLEDNDCTFHVFFFDIEIGVIWFNYITLTLFLFCVSLSNVWG